MFLLDGYPFLLVEVCSDPEHRDRYRLLVHAGILVRVMNSIKPKNKDSFVAVAVYITETYTAERYLVYQPSRDSKVVRIANCFNVIFAAHLLFRRLNMLRIASASRLPTRHSCSFLNSITSSPPCPPMLSSRKPPLVFQHYLGQSKMQNIHHTRRL